MLCGLGLFHLVQELCRILGGCSAARRILTIFPTNSGVMVTNFSLVLLFATCSVEYFYDRIDYFHHCTIETRDKLIGLD